MKKTVITMLLLGLSSVAYAEPSSLVAFDVPTKKLIASGDYARGETIAKEEKCQRCHNMNGLSDDTEDPNIAGMSRTYMFKQLKDYQTKNRDERSMYKAVRDLNDQQLADVAAYYSAQEMLPQANPDAVPPVLVHKGDPKRMIRSCNSCHGQDGKGGMHDFPALIGQRKGYFVAAMEEFRDEDRENDIYSRMRAVSKDLTDEEIEELANFYASVDPEE